MAVVDAVLTKTAAAQLSWAGETCSLLATAFRNVFQVRPDLTTIKHLSSPPVLRQQVLDAATQARYWNEIERLYFSRDDAAEPRYGKGVLYCHSPSDLHPILQA